MTLEEAVFAQTQLLAGELDAQRHALLRLLCRSAASGLAARLRAGLRPEDCASDFITAASLYAVAALAELDGAVQPEQVQLGDITLHRTGGGTAAQCLRNQAELVAAPYVRDSFAFTGV